MAAPDQLIDVTGATIKGAFSLPNEPGRLPAVTGYGDVPAGLARDDARAREAGRQAKLVRALTVLADTGQAEPGKGAQA